MAAALEKVRVTAEAADKLGKLSIVVDLKATTCCLQTLRLLEMLVIRTKEYGLIPYGCLQHIMNAYTEATAHIRDCGIMVDRRQQAKALNDQAVGITHTLLRCLSVAYTTSFEQLFYLRKMVLANDMWRNDQLPFRMLIEVLDEDLFVGLP